MFKAYLFIIVQNWTIDICPPPKKKPWTLYQAQKSTQHSILESAELFCQGDEGLTAKEHEATCLEEGGALTNLVPALFRTSSLAVYHCNVHQQVAFVVCLLPASPEPLAIWSPRACVSGLSLQLEEADIEAVTTCAAATLECKCNETTGRHAPQASSTPEPGHSRSMGWGLGGWSSGLLSSFLARGILNMCNASLGC
jgi:hypothetical protein